MTSALALLPLAVVISAALVILLLEAVWGKSARKPLGSIALVFLAGGALACIKSWNKGYAYFGGRLSLDNLSLVLIGLLLLSTLMVVLVSLKYVEIRSLPAAEFYALLLLALAGGMVMVSSSSLLIIFLGLEILSVSSYVLAGLHFRDPKSAEAAAKYFLLGSLSSAFLVFGMAWLYGASRSLDISGVAAALRGDAELGLEAWAGFGLVAVAFAFKVALVPFHMWTPDVYEGAPTPATAFFSAAPKVAGFAVLIRVLAALGGPGDRGGPLVLVLSGLAVLTMLVGTLAALRQSNLKRLLAYSSIAHAGYITVGLLAEDYAGVLFYLAAYLFMGVGAFAAAVALSGKDRERLELDDLAGLGFKYPWLGISLSVFALSLAGFPPLAGFLGKFTIFSSAVHQDLVPLAVIGVLTSVVSVFFYLKIIVCLYMREPSGEVTLARENPALLLVLFLCLLGVFQLGLNPGNILALVRMAAAGL